MPQLDFSTYAPQIIWLVITFGVLYLIMARVALPRIANVIEGRRDRIANDLDDAERLRQESETAIASYEAALAQARGKAHEIAQQARTRLNAELDRERSALDEKLASAASLADATIKEAKQAAMTKIGAAAGEAADDIVALLVGGKRSADKISKAVATAIKA